jgi:hypothetical protein
MQRGQEVEVWFKAKVVSDNENDTFDLAFEDGAIEKNAMRKLIHFITDVDVELRLQVIIDQINNDGTFDVKYACGKIERGISSELIHVPE